MRMKKCVKCVLTVSYPGIAFNEEGVCNYCLTHGKREYRGKEELIRIVNRYRNNKDFDCIVGLSGGRDSSYLLYYAVRELNLRVLAYTIDNGFMPEQTRSNIETMTKILKVEHIFEKHDHTKRCIKRFISSWMRRPSPAMLSSMCVGCRLGMILGFLKTARRYQIPLLLTGGGEPESSFARRFFTTGSNNGTKSTPLLVGYILEIMRNPSYILSPTFLITAVGEYVCCFSGFPMVRKLIYPDQKYVPFFRYIEWNEREILSVITNELKWETYSYSKSTWRSDCKINLLKNYLYDRTVGFTKNDELLSGMIRENMITREEALERLAEENIIPEQFVIEFFDELGLDYHGLDTALKSAKESWQHVL
jgi:hypothetical protein